VDPEALQRRLDPLEHLRHRVALLGRELGDVLPLVTVLRRLLPAPDRLDRLAELRHLCAGIVVVVLALDVVPGELQQARDRVPDRAVARRRDRDRAGRVRGDHLDLHLLRPPRRAAAEPGSGLEHLPQGLAEPGGCEPEVDEAGAGDLCALDLLQVERRGSQLLPELARGSLAHRRELHRDIGRVVAMLGVVRPLQLDRRTGKLREPRLQARDGVSSHAPR